MVAATSAVAVALPIGGASAAGRGFDVSVRCDPGARTVTAVATDGRGYSPGLGLTVVFQSLGGSYASATASGPLPRPLPAEVRIPVTTEANGSFSVRGFERPWLAEGDLFYHEKIRVRVRNAASGVEYKWKDASCYHDRRTTATFACDTGTGDLDVHASGVLYTRHSSVLVRYYELRTYFQADADTPMFVGQDLGDPVPTRAVTVPVADDGSWSDPGIRQPGPSTAYYAAADYLIVVSATGPSDPYEVGHGEGLCIWADQRPA